jgi:hypothetical protein
MIAARFTVSVGWARRAASQGGSMFVFIKDRFREFATRATAEQMAIVENTILRETLANAEFSRHLEGKIDEALKAQGGGYKSSS